MDGKALLHIACLFTELLVHRNPKNTDIHFHPVIEPWSFVAGRPQCSEDFWYIESAFGVNNSSLKKQTTG
jgi:hypothetical protein